MSRSYRHELGVGVMVLIAAVLTGWMALKVGSFGMGDHKKYTADFTNVAGIHHGSGVSVSGVNVGRVDGIRLTDGGAQLTLLVSPSVTLHADAKALIRARSVLGEKYVAIEPGSSNSPELEGRHIPNTQGQVEIDELLMAAGSLLEGVDTQKLANAIDAFSAALEDDPERPTRLLEGAESLLGELRALANKGSMLAAEGQHAAESVSSLSQQASSLIKRSEQIVADLELAVGHLPSTTEGLPLLVGDVRAAAADLRTLIENFSEQKANIEKVLANLSEIDKWELRRLLREEGILLRLRHSEVKEDESTSETSP